MKEQGQNVFSPTCTSYEAIKDMSSALEFMKVWQTKTNFESDTFIPWPRSQMGTYPSSNVVHCFLTSEMRHLFIILGYN